MIAQIVYAAAGGEVRRIILVEDWTGLIPHHLNPDEACLLAVPDEALADGVPDLDACGALIAADRERRR